MRRCLIPYFLASTVLCVVALAGCGKVRDSLARLRGDAYRHGGRHAEAIEVYQRIPTNRQPMAVLEGLAECYLQEGMVSNAIGVYERIYARSRNDADLVRLVWLLLDFDQHSAALRPLRELVNRQPDDLGYRELLVFTQLQSARSNQLPAELRRMETELDPTPTNLAALASWSISAGDYSNGVRLLRRALAGQPDNCDWRAALSQALIEDEQWDAAISNLSLVTSAEPGNADALQLLGYTLTEAGRADEGIAAFRRALRIDQDNVLALNNLAYTLLLTGGDAREAYELAQSAVQSERTSFTLDTLAYACYRRGSHATALRYLREAERLLRAEGRDYDAEMDFHYGLVLAELDRLDEAVPRFERALRVMPQLKNELRRRRYYDTILPYLNTHPE
jgi:Flp pilus assembly protein TadD